MGNRETIEDFKQYQEDDRSYYKGEFKNGSHSESYADYTWVVDGTCRCIVARIFVGGKIVRTKSWSYDNIIESIRQHNHKKMMLAALRWASWNSEDDDG